MSASAPQTLDVTARRTYPAPVEAVWAAWTESELIRRWWGPEGFTCPLARMDVRAGGVSLLAMQAPQRYGGGQTYNTWTYSVVEPMARLEYVMRFADPTGTTISPADAGIPFGVPDAVPHVVTFTPTADGSTELSITESGYTTAPARDMSQAGLDQCLDKLAVALADTAGTQPPRPPA
ncbi:SRPBCC domain-containing protein [Micromonospora sp. CPCC 205371]|nr:SRPBCC domain-containing protein [Micromonospora sp. CPCC 205371]